MKHKIIVDTPENVRKILRNERDETQRANDGENVRESKKLAERYAECCDDHTWLGAFLRQFYLQRMCIRSRKSTSVDFSAIIPIDNEIAQALQAKGWYLKVIPGTGSMEVSNFKENI